MRLFVVVSFAALACTHAPQQQPTAAAPEQQQQVQAAPLAPGDLVSPITAAGHEEPRGLDWPPERLTQPSSAVFKIVKVLGALPAGRFMAAMQSMQANLGKKCLLCHAVEKRD